MIWIFVVVVGLVVFVKVFGKPSPEAQEEIEEPLDNATSQSVADNHPERKGKKSKIRVAKKKNKEGANTTIRIMEDQKHILTCTISDWLEDIEVKCFIDNFEVSTFYDADAAKWITGAPACTDQLREAMPLIRQEWKKINGNRLKEIQKAKPSLPKNHQSYNDLSVKIKYTDAYDNFSIREVLVYGIRESSDCYYLNGFCKMRQEERLFRSDRIETIQNLETGKTYYSFEDFLIEVLPD